jgi:hypothetical protein
VTEQEKAELRVLASNIQDARLRHLVFKALFALGEAEDFPKPEHSKRAR